MGLPLRKVSFFFRSGLNGSAICIYTVNQLENVFKSSYLIQKSNESYWLPSSNKQETEKVFMKKTITFRVIFKKFL